MMWEDLRGAVRFPVHLPVILMVNGTRMEASTVNISNNGVLLQVPEPIPSDAGLEFLLEVPTEQMQDGSTAAIHCTGHVIRSYREDDSCFVAAVIDEYCFQ